MKKLFALFMTLCVSAALIGCGDAGAKKEEKKGAAPAPAAGGEEKKEEGK